MGSFLPIYVINPNSSAAVTDRIAWAAPGDRQTLHDPDELRPLLDRLRTDGRPWRVELVADPATPPRHGERVAKLLGAKARHVVVPQAGHGTLSLACMRDAVVRFVDAATDDEALKVDASCAAHMPRATVFVPLQAAVEGSQ